MSQSLNPVPIYAMSSERIAENVGTVLLSVQDLEAMQDPQGNFFERIHRDIESRELIKDRIHCLIADYVREKCNSDLFRSGQKEVFSALSSGEVKIQTGKTPSDGCVTDEQLTKVALFPLAATQPGLQANLGTGSGKTLIGCVTAYLQDIGSMPVPMDCFGQQFQGQILTAAELLEKVLVENLQSDDPEIDKIFQQLRHDNADVTLYRTSNDGKVHLTMSSLYFGYSKEPPETLLQSLPNITKKLMGAEREEIEEKIEKFQSVFQNATGFRAILPDSEEDLDTLIIHTFMSGLIAYTDLQGRQQIRIVARKLYQTFFGHDCDLCKVYPSLYDTVLIGSRPYCLISWFLGRTVSCIGGWAGWQPLIPKCQENINTGKFGWSCHSPSKIHEVVLIVSLWQTLKNRNRFTGGGVFHWLGMWHGSKLIRDEADVASSDDTKTTTILRSEVEPAFALSMHLSGTLDLRSSLKRLVRSIFGGLLRAGYALNRSVESSDSSIPDVLYYRDGIRPIVGPACVGGGEKPTTGLLHFLSALAKLNYEVLLRAQQIPGEDFQCTEAAKSYNTALYSTAPIYAICSFPNRNALHRTLNGLRRMLAGVTAANVENCSPFQQMAFDFFHPNGGGMFTSYMKKVDGDMTYVCIGDGQLVRKQYLKIIVDTGEGRYLLQSPLDKVKDCPLEQRESKNVLENGEANLLLVVSKHARGFDLPLLLAAIALRSRAMKTTALTQFQGRVVRNEKNFERVYDILNKQIKHGTATVTPRGTEEEKKAQILTFIGGSGSHQKFHRKLLIIPDSKQQMISVARSFFFGNFRKDLIEAIVGHRIYTCPRCAIPTDVDISEEDEDLSNQDSDTASRSLESNTAIDDVADADTADNANTVSTSCSDKTGDSFDNDDDGDDQFDDFDANSGDGGSDREESMEQGEERYERRCPSKRPCIDPRIPSYSAAFELPHNIGDGNSTAETNSIAISSSQDPGEANEAVSSNAKLNNAIAEDSDGEDEGYQELGENYGEDQDENDANEDEDDEDDEDEEEEEEEEDDDDDDEEEEEEEEEEESDDKNESEDELELKGKDEDEDEKLESEGNEEHKEGGEEGSMSDTQENSSGHRHVVFLPGVNGSLREDEDATQDQHGMHFDENFRWISCTVCKKPACFVALKRYRGVRPELLVHQLASLPYAVFRACALCDESNQKRCGFTIDRSHLSKNEPPAHENLCFAQENLILPNLKCLLCLQPEVSSADFDKYRNSNHSEEQLILGVHCHHCKQELRVTYIKNTTVPSSKEEEEEEGYACVSSNDDALHPNASLFLARRSGNSDGCYYIHCSTANKGPQFCKVCAEGTIETIEFERFRVNKKRDSMEYELFGDKEDILKKRIKSAQRQCRKGGCTAMVVLNEHKYFCETHASCMFFCDICFKALDIQYQSDHLSHCQGCHLRVQEFRKKYREVMHKVQTMHPQSPTLNQIAGMFWDLDPDQFVAYQENIRIEKIDKPSTLCIVQPRISQLHRLIKIPFRGKPEGLKAFLEDIVEAINGIKIS